MGVGSEQEDGIILSSCPFLRHLLSQLPRFRESGTVRGGGPPSMIDNTHFFPSLITPGVVGVVVIHQKILGFQLFGPWTWDLKGRLRSASVGVLSSFSF